MTEALQATNDPIETAGKAVTIIIADDDPAIVRFLAERCTKMGFSVDTANNGIQLLMKARRNQPDILIVDVNMPGLNGLSVCKRLLNPDNKPFEVVVITGSADPETIERCESLGMFYARKGPRFIADIESALTEICPAMSRKIEEFSSQDPDTEIHNRSRVLVVDDDPSMDSFLSGRLLKYGVDTLYAPNAVQGYRMACREEPSVIICDYYMPNGDAFYLLWRLRTTPATQNIPVFVISARKIDEVSTLNLRREICGHPGATDIFRKSFETEELFKALQQYCGFEIKRETDLLPFAAA
jgi:CheY-like chemotaxis protein